MEGTPFLLQGRHAGSVEGHDPSEMSRTMSDAKAIQTILLNKYAKAETFDKLR
jgi:hypothetical protein